MSFILHMFFLSMPVWIVSKYGVRAQPVQDPFEAYSKYYNIYEEKKTLFLIVISDITISPIHACKFVQHFQYVNFIMNIVARALINVTN